MPAVVDMCVVAVDPTVLFAWCVRLGEKMFYDEDPAEEYARRAYSLCLLGCPCSSHQAKPLPSSGENFVAGPASRRRMTTALQSAVVDGTVVWSSEVRHRVSNVIRDALGDTPRLRAAGTSFTAKPGRVLDELPMSVGAKEVMSRLILGATGWRHGAAMGFFVGRSDVRVAATYVVDSIRSSRRSPQSGANFVAAVSVSQIAEFIREGRAMIIARDPRRWEQLVGECRGWLTRPLGEQMYDDQDEDSVVMAHLDGRAGYVDPAEVVTERPARLLDRVIDFVEGGPLHAVMKDLRTACDKKVAPVTAWLLEGDDVPPPAQVLGWLDAARNRRSHAARTVPFEDLAGLVVDARDFLTVSHPEFWASVLCRMGPYEY